MPHNAARHARVNVSIIIHPSLSPDQTFLVRYDYLFLVYSLKTFQEWAQYLFKCITDMPTTYYCPSLNLKETYKPVSKFRPLVEELCYLYAQLINFYLPYHVKCICMTSLNNDLLFAILIFRRRGRWTKRSGQCAITSPCRVYIEINIWAYTGR